MNNDVINKPAFDPKIVDQLFQLRRSVFIDQFVPGKKIPDEIIWQILENANHAPTHKLTEPWRFTVFSDEGLKTLAEKQAAIYKAFAGSNFKQNKYEKLLVTPRLCSHVIAISLRRHREIPEIEEIAAVACAVENIYLSCTAYGIGGYFSTGGITYIEEAKELFGLGFEDILMGFFFVGYIHVPSVKRVPGDIREKVTWIKD